MDAKVVTVNNEQRLFVIPCSNGYSCLGFDVLSDKCKALRKEMELPESTFLTGTIEAYNEYAETVNLARKTGKRYSCELHPKLIGLEGFRVQCEIYGEKVRFNVGKSTGFMPCHLQINNARSLGGFAISPTAEIKNLVVIRKVR